MPDKVEIDENELYNIQDTTKASPMYPNIEGWISTRKNGKPYYALFQSAGSQIRGGEKLKVLLEENPHYRAVPITKYAKRRNKK